MSQPEMRIGDAERDDTLSLLGDHFAAGRLTRPEFDERTARALGARTKGELDTVMVDLPAIPTANPAGTLDTISSAGDPGQLALTSWRRTMLLPWAIFGVFFIVLWAMTGAGYFWPIWPIMGWGIAVVTRGIVAYKDPTSFLNERQRRSLGSPPPGS